MKESNANPYAVFRNWTFSEEFKIPITFNLMQLQLQLQFLLFKKSIPIPITIPITFKLLKNYFQSFSKL